MSAKTSAERMREKRERDRLEDEAGEGLAAAVAYGRLLGEDEVRRQADKVYPGKPSAEARIARAEAYAAWAFQRDIETRISA